MINNYKQKISFEMSEREIKGFQNPLKRSRRNSDMIAHEDTSSLIEFTRKLSLDRPLTSYDSLKKQYKNPYFQSSLFSSKSFNELNKIVTIFQKALGLLIESCESKRQKLVEQDRLFDKLAEKIRLKELQIKNMQYYNSRLKSNINEVRTRLVSKPVESVIKQDDDEDGFWNNELLENSRFSRDELQKLKREHKTDITRKYSNREEMQGNSYRKDDRNNISVPESQKRGYSLKNKPTQKDNRIRQKRRMEELPDEMPNLQNKVLTSNFKNYGRIGNTLMHTAQIKGFAKPQPQPINSDLDMIPVWGKIQSSGPKASPLLKNSPNQKKVLREQQISEFIEDSEDMIKIQNKCLSSNVKTGDNSFSEYDKEKDLQQCRSYIKQMAQFNKISEEYLKTRNKHYKK